MHTHTRTSNQYSMFYDPCGNLKFGEFYHPFSQTNSMELRSILVLQGVVASALSFAAQTWVIDRAGPVFVSVYLPVQTLLVAVMASVVLGEEFYFGGWVSSLPWIFTFSFNFFFYYKKKILSIPLRATTCSKRTTFFTITNMTWYEWNNINFTRFQHKNYFYYIPDKSSHISHYQNFCKKVVFTLLDIL